MCTLTSPTVGPVRCAASALPPAAGLEGRHERGAFEGAPAAGRLLHPPPLSRLCATIRCRAFPLSSLRPAVLLIQAAQRWKEAHGGQVPGTNDERRAFKQGLQEQQRHFDGIPLEVSEPCC